MTWYLWDPETDKLTKAKYDILRDPEELWLPEMYEIGEAHEKNRIISQVMIRDICISTIFMSLDCGWGRGDPVCFETMVFDELAFLVPGKSYTLFQDRYTSGKAAKAGHHKIERISRWLLTKAPHISKPNYSQVLREL